MKNTTRANQEKIYGALYDKYRGTPMAVSSESLAHKKLRFDQISRILLEDRDDRLSIHDVGMGLGDFYQFIKDEKPEKEWTYSGSEILDDYVREAKERFPECDFFLRDIAENSYSEQYDYLVMSGVFHQRRDSKIGEWEHFSQEIIKNSFAMAKRGVVFNFISPFVDFYQTEVYYCNLPKLLNFINDDLSRFFKIHHNYALFEFTVAVFKEDFISSQYDQPEFRKYFKA